MLFIGYFEGIGSQRGIAWRCADSRSLGEFLGLAAADPTPDHSSLTRIRQRLPLEVHEAVFEIVLGICRAHGLVKGKRVAVDSTTLEANAAMKAIRRKATGESWREYVTRLAREAGIEDPTDEELRRFDKKRKKKVSNDDWESPSDPDARIAKMKDGRTRLAYKAEHAVDLDSDLILAARIHPADRGDPDTLAETVKQAQTNVTAAGSEVKIRDVAADKGYHKAQTLAEVKEIDIRTYIPERRDKRKRRWTDKPEGWREAFHGNRRRCRGARGKALQRLRSEKVERSFAHVCNTGGARRTWLRGFEKVTKRYLIQAAGHNLGVLMRKLYGLGKPRGLADLAGLLRASLSALLRLLRAPWSLREAAESLRSPNAVHRPSLHGFPANLDLPPTQPPRLAAAA